MWAYEVSGKNVLRQWFSYRRRDRSKPVIGDRRRILKRSYGFPKKSRAYGDIRRVAVGSHDSRYESSPESDAFHPNA
jgi:hypothetical protein